MAVLSAPPTRMGRASSIRRCPPNRSEISVSTAIRPAPGRRRPTRVSHPRSKSFWMSKPASRVRSIDSACSSGTHTSTGRASSPLKRSGSTPMMVVDTPFTTSIFPGVASLVPSRPARPSLTTLTARLARSGRSAKVRPRTAETPSTSK